MVLVLFNDVFVCVTVRAAADGGPQADGGIGLVVLSHGGDIDRDLPCYLLVLV